MIDGSPHTEITTDKRKTKIAVRLSARCGALRERCVAGGDQPLKGEGETRRSDGSDGYNERTLDGQRTRADMPPFPPEEVR